MTPAFVGGILVGVYLVTLASVLRDIFRAKAESDSPTITCTLEDVVEAVLKEYRGIPPLLATSEESPSAQAHMSAERIAANLIQIVDEKGAKQK